MNLHAAFKQLEASFPGEYFAIDFTFVHNADGSTEAEWSIYGGLGDDKRYTPGCPSLGLALEMLLGRAARASATEAEEARAAESQMGL